jgi:hypothetical protein
MAYQPHYEEKYIPDMSVWTNLSSMPFCGARILKINNTLYAFGTYNSGSNGKIYSTAWNNPTGWADTGITFAGLGADSCVGVVGSTIYFWGNNSGVGNNIWSAPVSNPLSWADTGSDWSASRNHTALVITPSHIRMMAGYSGATVQVNNVCYAPIATPTVFSTGSTIAGWQTAGCYLDGVDVHAFGGVGVSTSIFSFSEGSPSKATFASTAPAYSVDVCPATFHVENRIYVTGGNNAHLYHADANNPHVPWDSYASVMPGNVNYAYGNWIGPDGYAYVVQAYDGMRLYRSARKRIFVIDPPAPSGKYTHRRAITESGGPSAYTIHCQMGMAPWYTNRRDKF